MLCDKLISLFENSVACKLYKNHTGPHMIQYVNDGEYPFEIRWFTDKKKRFKRPANYGAADISSVKRFRRLLDQEV